MIREIWVAKLSEDEQKQADHKIIMEMIAELEEFWSDLKEEFLLKEEEKK